MKIPPISEREFASIIREHSRIINKVCYFYATDRMPYEDLRQEIYMNIWLGLNQFKGESKMSTWIYRVAVNSALMTLRSSRQRIETISSDFGIIDASTEIDDEQRENLQTLQWLINRLEGIEKAIILLWLDEYSYEEIADMLGLKRNTVAVKIHRIKEHQHSGFNTCKIVFQDGPTKTIHVIRRDCIRHRYSNSVYPLIP